MGTLRHKRFGLSFEGLEDAPAGTLQRLTDMRREIMSGGAGQPKWAKAARCSLHLAADGRAVWRGDLGIGQGAVTLEGSWAVRLGALSVVLADPKPDEPGPPQDFTAAGMVISRSPSLVQPSVDAEGTPLFEVPRFNEPSIYVRAKWGPDPDVRLEMILTRRSDE